LTDIAADKRRLRGELSVLSSPRRPEDAEKDFRTALSIAFTQRSKILALRAVMSLARLYSTADMGVAAREVLAAALEWFNDGPGTRDAYDGRRLLHSVPEPADRDGRRHAKMVNSLTPDVTH
jgi:hypothetical protein